MYCPIFPYFVGPVGAMTAKIPFNNQRLMVFLGVQPQIWRGLEAQWRYANERQANPSF